MRTLDGRRWRIGAFTFGWSLRQVYVTNYVRGSWMLGWGKFGGLNVEITAAGWDLLLWVMREAH